MEERGCLLWMCLLALPLGNGAITECREAIPEGLFVCRELSHATSTLACHRPQGWTPPDPQVPGGCWWHLAEARLGQVPPAKPQFPQLWSAGGALKVHCEELRSSCVALLTTWKNWDLRFPGVPKGSASPTSQEGVGCHPTGTCSSGGSVLWSQH